MKEECLSGEWKGTIKNITHDFQISVFTFVYMNQFGSNLSRYAGWGAVHSERVEGCSCVSSGIIYNEKRVNMSVTLVTIPFSSKLIFAINSLYVQFHFNVTHRNIKVDHSVTELNFFDKSCLWHSWSNLVEIPSQILVKKVRMGGWNVLYIKLPFYARHRKTEKIYKASGYKCFVLRGHMFPSAAFCTDFVTVRHTASFSRLLYYTSLCT
jgi:hypothetical protein